jgi:hypothetical protein
METGDYLLEEDACKIILDQSTADPATTTGSRLTDPVFAKMSLGTTAFFDNGDS